MDLGLPPPTEFGLPAKFDSWRKFQGQAVLDALSSDKRFIAMCLPCGVGKSGAGIVLANIDNLRMVYLTSSKALQGQLMADFESTGLVSVQGQANYDCIDPDSNDIPYTCQDCPCHHGLASLYPYHNCGYRKAVELAKNSRLVVTNYAFWISQQKYGEGIGKVDLLVLDEAHSTDSEINNQLTVELIQNDLLETLGRGLPDPSFDYSQWAEWGEWTKKSLEDTVKELTSEAERLQKNYHKIPQDLQERLVKHKRLLKNVANLSEIKEYEWVIEHFGEGVRFSPINPARFTEHYLFAGVPKILLMSATIRKKTLSLLGIPKDKLDFFDYESPFPVERRPIYIVPSIRVNHRITDSGLRIWVSKIDQIIRKWMYWGKGIIHCVSYDRMRYLLAHSEFSQYMMYHDSRTTRDVVAKFKRANAPAVLVSPSVSTGYDFPANEGRWQIIAKVPYPDSRSAVIQAKRELDRDYETYTAIQTLSQMSGRIHRAEDDFSYTAITDDSIKYLLYRYKAQFPKWFLDAVQYVDAIPDPPEL